MICPTAIEAANRILLQGEISRPDAIAVALELIAAADVERQRNIDGVREIAAIVSTWEET